MNEDLARERAKSSISAEVLTRLIDGSTANTTRRRYLEAILKADPAFSNADNMFMSKAERYRHGLKKMCRVKELKEELGLSPEDLDTMLENMGDFSPTVVHSLMFCPNVEALCDEDQRNYWLPRCLSMEVTGCYAQTELGHGSNIRALETTATFIRDTDQFEIHTPSITATKWWPGSMGSSANHAMVIAQLIIDGKLYGIHNFIVPIRGEDHLPLPGIRVGNVGPKIGFHSVDNGFCAFDRVRIPRRNMMMRYQRVDRQGNYVSTGSQESSKLAYITMMQVRGYIVGAAGKALAKAVTIATRYSIVRRQGFRADMDTSKGGGDSHAEHQVLDYTVQMHRLLPLVATAYGFQFVGQSLKARLHQLERVHIHGESSTGASGEEGAQDTLKRFHAASSGLKILCSTITAAGIEDCRRSCGGHGYLEASGLPELLGTYLQNCTVEGENHMLSQQVGRVLLQELAVARKGGAVGLDCGYMTRLLHEERQSRTNRRWPVTTPQALGDSDMVEQAFEHRVFRLLRRVETRLSHDLKRGYSASQAWNRALVEVHRVSDAHASLLVLKAFRAVVEGNKPRAASTHTHGRSPCATEMDESTWSALSLMLSLLGLYWIQNDMGSFTEDGYVDEQQSGWVRDEVVEILHLLRPMAISLVDAWDLSELNLNSALGRFDGRVYEALLEATQRDPMNKHVPSEGYAEYLEPIIRGAREARLREESSKEALQALPRRAKL